MKRDELSVRFNAAGTVKVGWIYNQGKCKHCEIALMGDIPPGSDLETWEFETRDICVWCKTSLEG